MPLSKLTRGVTLPVPRHSGYRQVEVKDKDGSLCGMLSYCVYAEVRDGQSMRANSVVQL